MTEQIMEHEKVSSLLERIIATQEVASSIEAKKWKWPWQNLFG